MRRSSLIVLLSLVLFSPVLPTGAPLAWADEEPTAEELFRQGQVAEEVDRDVERAIDLYRRALDRPGPFPGTPEMIWRLARLYESQGKKADALSALRALSREYADQMDDKRIREVHEAMLRLVAPGTPETSPLERKILDMFDRYDRAPEDRRHSVESDMRTSLWGVGKSALPILEKIAISGSPRRARMAAGYYAGIGGVEALPGLEKLARDGDAFTRRAAVNALMQIRPGPETSPAFVPVVDRLRALDLPEDLALVLRKVLGGHLDGPAMLERHRRGDEDRWWYLEQALDKRAPGALERTMELVRGGGEEGRKALVVLLPFLVPARSSDTTYPMESLTAADAVQAFELLVGQPFDGKDATAGALTGLTRVIESTAGAEEGAKAREAMWRLYARTDAPGSGRALMQDLARNRFAPPPELLEDEVFARALFSGWRWLQGTYTQAAMLQSLMSSGALFWEVWLRTLPLLPEEDRERLVRVPESGLPKDGLPPEAYDTAWVDLMVDLPHLTLGNNRAPQFMVRAAARSGDPRFLDLLRKQTIQRRWNNYDYTWIRALGEYRGPGRLAFVEEALADEHFVSGVAQPLLRALAEDKSEASRALVVRIASDWHHPLARGALNILDDTGYHAEDEMLAITRSVQAATEEVPPDYRMSLITAIRIMHLREGVPYLIHEFRRGPLAKQAIEAMDSILAYHKRLEQFEAFAREEKAEDAGSAPTGRRVEDLLGDDDPEIRRAAILALAAMGRTQALDSIVFLAKEDPDEAVRAAALRAVERMAGER